jgi:hypothetical protein
VSTGNCLLTQVDFLMNTKKRKRLIQLRRQAFLSQNCQCFYCRLLMWEQGGKQLAKRMGIPIRLARYLRCTAEHLRPQANGGPDTPENVVAACAWCNHERHAHQPNDAPDPLTYRAQVADYMALGGWHPAELAAVFKLGAS